MSLNSPEATIIIPTYNYAHFLKKCLKSLISQTFTDWEAIVVNNFSTDDTAAVVEGFCDKRIRLVNCKNNGIIAISRNKGIELACSALIAFLDSDDIWYPEKLRRCIEEFNNGADVVCHGMRYIVNGAYWKDVVCAPRTRFGFFDALYNRSGIITSATAVRRKCLLEVGGFDENPDIVTAEDYDLWLRLSKGNYRFQFMGDILGEYNCHGSSFSRQVYSHMRAGLTVINKYSRAPVAGAAPFYIFKIKRAKALFLYGIARNFQREGKRLMALRFFLKALAIYPFLLRPYAAILLTALPRSIGNIISSDLPAREWLSRGNNDRIIARS